MNWGEIYDIYDKRPKNNLSKKPIRDIQGNPAMMQQEPIGARPGDSLLRRIFRSF